jgi:hypothetical protein
MSDIPVHNSGGRNPNFPAPTLDQSALRRASVRVAANPASQQMFKSLAIKLSGSPKDTFNQR